MSAAPTLLKLVKQNGTEVHFCHGLPVPKESSGIVEQDHNMWADASDVTAGQESARGTGLTDVNPHRLVEGYTNEKIKFFAINAHQDMEHLKIWDNRISTHAHLNKIDYENTCFGLYTAKEDVDLTDMGTYVDKVHRGAVVIHSTAVNSKIKDGPVASYLEMLPDDKLYFRIATTQLPSPTISKDEIRAILSSGNDVMSILRTDDNFWKLCYFWANVEFGEFLRHNEKAYYKEQANAIVLTAAQAQNVMTYFNTNFTHPPDPPSDSHVFFFGDLHCSVGSLARILLTLKDRGVIGPEGNVGKPYALISGGDLIDRGFLGVSCVLLIYFIALQTRKKKEGYVGICRGNHEDCEVASIYGFRDEIKKRNSLALTSTRQAAPIQVGLKNCADARRDEECSAKSCWPSRGEITPGHCGKVHFH